MELNVAGWIAKSTANGPGERFVLWMQGCPLACEGCWNPDTWSFAPRRVLTIDSLEPEIVAAAGIEGITFSGGEPFAQAAPLAELARRGRQRGLSVVVFTGHELAELRWPAARELLAEADILVAGRFVRAQRDVRLAWRGSRNQELHFLTDRYSPADVPAANRIELHLAVDGSVVLTGFPEDACALSADSTQKASEPGPDAISERTKSPSP
jgi:anaerobic ribonucleoside-triphosphate reductase activating protein